MLPAALPTCVFFTLYVLAGVGFFLSALAVEALELGTDTLDLPMVGRATVNAVAWPVLVVAIVIVFVARGGRV